MNKPIISLFALIAVGSLGAALYFHLELESVKADPQKVVQQETASLIASVGALIVLPEGETPTIATVSDPELLKDQPFFAKAQTGDKVLIYTNAKKAILYNPRSHKIVEVAPVNIGDTESSATTDATASN